MFWGGPCFTSDPARLVTEAVATKDDRIIAVGTKQQISALVGADTTVIDLDGRMLMPGFIDAHVHMISHGLNKLRINLKYPNVHSIADIQSKVRQERLTDKWWIRGWGYDHLKLRERRHPNRHDLDEVCKDKPVILTRTCGHISCVNSLALEMAKITKDTPDPKGGKYDRDEDGTPNGVLRETACDPVLALSRAEDKELEDAVAAADDEFLSHGITSAHEAGVLSAELRAFRKAFLSGRLRVRVYAMLGYKDMCFHETFFASGISTGFGDTNLRIGPIKLMADGSSSGPTAATRQPYAIDPEDHGILYLTQDEINSRFEKAHALGFQVTAHAVGDRAVDMIINGIEHCMRAKHREDPRHRIEHCGMTDPKSRERIRDLGIVPVMQPVFLHEFGDGYVLNYGEERARQMFAASSVLNMGVTFAMSTDCPVTFCDPMLNVYTAVTRRTMSGQVVGHEQAIAVPDALYAYTMGGAIASFEEHIKGSLKPGKLADLVVLSKNPLDADIDELRDIRADMTFVGGALVFDGRR